MVKTTDPTTLWNISQGISAYARGVANTDERIRLETTAGDMLNPAGRRSPARSRSRTLVASR
jgi:hypothetical protein